MIDQALDAGWGEWSLGDLPTALRRAAEALGHGESVVEVHLVPPSADDEPPRVTVIVPTTFAAARLAESLTAASFLIRWVEEPNEQGWVAEVLGVRLIVRATGGAS